MIWQRVLSNRILNHYSMEIIMLILVLLISVALIISLRLRRQENSYPDRQEIITDHGGHCCKEIYEDGKLIDREWID